MGLGRAIYESWLDGAILSYVKFIKQWNSRCGVITDAGTREHFCILVSSLSPDIHDLLVLSDVHQYSLETFVCSVLSLNMISFTQTTPL